MTVLLEVSDLHVSYGPIEVLSGIDLQIEEGEMVSLLGGNGSGKSTTLRTLAGFLKPTKGEVRFRGQRVERLSPELHVRKGIMMVPEGRRIFPKMTVRENLELGAYIQNDPKVVREDTEKMLILFPSLKKRLNQLGGTLSGGEQQMLATSRALMSRPKLLLMDEPSMGLSPVLFEKVISTIQQINRQGTAVLLVEQNAYAALHITRRGYVLEKGRIALHDESRVLLANEKFRKIFLGRLADKSPI